MGQEILGRVPSIISPLSIVLSFLFFKDLECCSACIIPSDRGLSSVGKDGRFPENQIFSVTEALSISKGLECCSACVIPSNRRLFSVGKDGRFPES
jgi:hypothetical protein